MNDDDLNGSEDYYYDFEDCDDNFEDCDDDCDSYNDHDNVQ